MARSELSQELTPRTVQRRPRVVAFGKGVEEEEDLNHIKILSYTYNLLIPRSSTTSTYGAPYELVV